MLEYHVRIVATYITGWVCSSIESMVTNNTIILLQTIQHTVFVFGHSSHILHSSQSMNLFILPILLTLPRRDPFEVTRVDFHGECDLVGRLEGGAQGSEFVDEAAEGPDVGRFVVSERCFKTV
jgi:hypothetical protein